MKATFPDYPFSGNFFEIDGVRMHYLDEGDSDAEVILMLHGNPSWSYYYRNAVAALSPNYRCIVPDHIGMGLSETPGEDSYQYTLPRRVDDLARLVEHLEIKKDVTLLLHDWGGMIGMAWANRFPEAVRRIVILNTAAFHLPEEASFPWQLTFSRSAAGALAIRGLNAFCRYAVKNCVTRRPMSRAVAEAYLAPYRSWHERLPVLRFVQDIPLGPEDEQYRLVGEVAKGLSRFSGLPAVIFWGMKDFVFNSAFLQKWTEYLPEAEVHRYGDSGHYLLEDSGEEIIPRIGEFLAAHPLASKEEERR